MTSIGKGNPLEIASDELLLDGATIESLRRRGQADEGWLTRRVDDMIRVTGSEVRH